MLQTLRRLFFKHRKCRAASRGGRKLRPTFALERLEARWVLDAAIGGEQRMPFWEPEPNSAVPAIALTASLEICGSGSGLAEFLRSGHRYGVNSSSDPVFQQAYTDLLACLEQSTIAFVSAGPVSSGGGWLDNYAEWFNSNIGSGYSETLGGVIYTILPISDETLANASDTSLLVGTTIASVPIAVGIVAGGEIVLGVGTLGGAATAVGTTTTVTAGVTVTEGVVGTTTAVVMADGTAIGTGTIIIGAETTTVAGTGTAIVIAEGGTAVGTVTSTTIVTMGGPTILAAGSTVFPTTTIVTGTATIVFGHGVTHLVGTTLTQSAVEAAIAGSASELAAAGITSGTFRIVVSGATIEFRMAIVEGIIRIGTYYLI